MPGRRGLDGPPASYVPSADGGRWDEVELGPGAPVAVVRVQQLVRNLRREMGGQSARQLALAADLQHTTVVGLLSGSRWPDMVTVTKLEAALGVDLWPRLGQ